MGTRYYMFTREFNNHCLHMDIPLKMKVMLTCQEKLCQNLTVHSKFSFLLLQEPSCFRNV